MNKKIINILLILLLIISIIFFQTFVINPRSLFGVKPNLILLLVVTVSLLYGLYIGTTFSFFVGVYINILYSTNIPIFILSYTLVGCIIGLLSENYRKENRSSLLYLLVLSTVIFEILEYIVYLLITKTYVNIFYVLWQIILETLLNLVFGYILYNLFNKIYLRVEKNRNIF